MYWEVGVEDGGRNQGVQEGMEGGFLFFAYRTVLCVVFLWVLQLDVSEGGSGGYTPGMTHQAIESSSVFSVHCVYIAEL
jgi:hypothetical protein